MTRIVLPAVLVFAALLPDIRPAAAAEGRWCAISSTGQGGMREDCNYATIEACQQAARIDRGTCSQNPRWSGSDTPKKPKRR